MLIADSCKNRPCIRLPTAVDWNRVWKDLNKWPCFGGDNACVYWWTLLHAVRCLAKDLRPEEGHFNHFTKCAHPFCNELDSQVHAFGDCPALINVWRDDLWPLLQRLISVSPPSLDGAFAFPSSMSARLRHIVLGFLPTMASLPPTMQVRCRVWFMLALQSICESRCKCFKVASSTSLPVLDYGAVTPRFVRLLLDLIGDRRLKDGPLFHARWLDGNSLLALQNDLIVLALYLFFLAPLAFRLL